MMSTLQALPPPPPPPILCSSLLIKESDVGVKDDRTESDDEVCISSSLSFTTLCILSLLKVLLNIFMVLWEYIIPKVVSTPH